MNRGGGVGGRGGRNGYVRAGRIHADWFHVKQSKILGNMP
jgi:hypothetical protein